VENVSVALVYYNKEVLRSRRGGSHYLSELEAAC
jgi:hypothetical protein